MDQNMAIVAAQEEFDKMSNLVQEINRLATQLNVWSNDRRKSTMLEKNKPDSQAVADRHEITKLKEEVRLLEQMVLKQRDYISSLHATIRLAMSSRKSS